MTVLEWDKVGERFFETGVDRGVLFPIDGEAVVWNGLTSITETVERDIKSYWVDGIKYLDHHVPGAYAGKLEAFTYPTILDELTGLGKYAPGVYLHDQKAKMFHLSYRTGVGNDLNPELGYKLHIIYNVMANPSSVGISSIGGNVDPGKFSWDLLATPPTMFGARPTSHISFHSQHIDPAKLQAIEDRLYGTESTNPILPTMIELLSLISAV